MTKNINQRIMKCWKQAQDKLDIQTIPFESKAKEIVKEVCTSIPFGRRINLLT
jgi:hypothetical protein